ncbi:chromosome segregation protein SMC [Arthrobacter sp. zg-Y820]|uniref:chromosome segregation protein SMC n=1 Tax=unclassified Arthrobacter TaxID=235627 RepID=UPI0025413457|nr:MULTISPECIES: chromosome segregation protein SMC [unclassified Arthrobacter]MCC9196228.1 chromosome segregation protein SMC [Arthrobacter sp. zg-Y820]MDK1279089.1 chromosome segregation protein SMC [Arthrobacter sp. zg.Y820]WIB08504.1 chromosome segregation protein SMC [Arthrobacter sp. zg-Y820]
MHLKTLTMRGFKSFASATTFEFEPGVTAVVGPNGSGKSNVVDALAWVMGEQGAKTLRGGKMEDVIFAGTSGRPALGRAQVSLTIDNADGALPIEYSEVTISRTLFRSGGSEYAINGAPVRLLDIQELLSDSGLGREMHVIVGQGQLDRILHAGADERRGFIEEAAGILKHRRRREKTVRKLDAMQANLSRLTDLTSELRRQLGPLGKQAAVARRARTVQQDARDARARLLADDLVTLTGTLARDAAEETALLARRDAAAAVLATARARQAELEGLAASATPRVNAARDSWYALSSLRERYLSLAALAEERRRLLGSSEHREATGSDPERLRAQAERVRTEAALLQETIEERRGALAEAEEVRAAAEAAAAAEEQRLAAVLRAAADRREGLARISGAVGAARSRVDAAEAELGRLRASITEGEERRRKAQQEFTALESSAAGAEEGEEGLDAEYEDALAELDVAAAALEELRRTKQEAERERETLTARRDALRVGLDRRDGSALLLESGLDGVLAPLAALLTVRSGCERAVTAALGAAAAAVAVADAGAAVRALTHLREAGGGQVDLVLAAGVAGVGGPTTTTAAGARPALADGALWAADVVEAPDTLRHTLAELLDGVVIVDSLASAAELLSAHPGLKAVTFEGEVLSAFEGRGGSASAPGLLELQAAVDETDERIRAAAARSEQAGFALAGTVSRRDAAQARTDAALADLHDSDARLAAVAERLGTLGSALRSAVGESERLQRLVHAAEGNLAAEQEALAAAAARLAAATEAPVEDEPSTEQREALALAAASARRAETDARLALRTAEEQHKAVAGRAAGLERAAESERRARAAAEVRARRRALQAAKATAVASAAREALRFLEVSLEAAAAERDHAEAVRTAWDAELAAVRTTAADAGAEVARLTDSVHRDELMRAQQQLRVEALETRAVEELGLTPDHLVAEFGPDQPVPVPVPAEGAAVGDKWDALHVPVDDAGNPLLAGVPYHRAAQEKRLKQAERDLAALGRVNPLALEEFAALEERHTFLSTQLEDLKATRRDLLDIIKDVDRQVEQVFSAAYRDTAVQFERVFATLFPGGEGRLVLTDPDNMLTTGIEIQARPAGKKIKRLSLLSGGERSLTAVALLVAIFKARPSPFYVMDEVEAALDDTNLGRLITIFEELKESSQLIVITHQKRTMEVADALYGVTMQGDGVSTVISQRLDKASGPAA